VVLGVILAAACGGKDKPAAAPTHRTPADEATVLGTELFDVMDQVMSFRSAHNGYWPRTLREVGVDSLTRTTIRRLGMQGSGPMITVLFRSAEGHQVEACRGGSDIQEEASLNSGQFTVSCALAGGGAGDFKVQGAR